MHYPQASAQLRVRRIDRTTWAVFESARQAAAKSLAGELLPADVVITATGGAASVWVDRLALPWVHAGEHRSPVPIRRIASA